MSNYGPFMDGMNQLDPLTGTLLTTGIKEAPSLITSIASIFGHGSGDQVDPAGAQRAAAYQQKIATSAALQQQAQEAALNRAQSAQNWSTLTKVLIFGGVGLVLFGTVGLLVYRSMKE